MSIKNKLLNIVSTHPRVTTTAAVFGIGLAITAIAGSVIGTFDHSHMAQAIVQTNRASIAVGILQSNQAR